MEFIDNLILTLNNLNPIELWFVYWITIQLLLYNTCNKPDIDGDYNKNATWIICIIPSGILAYILL